MTVRPRRREPGDHRHDERRPSAARAINLRGGVSRLGAVDRALFAAIARARPIADPLLPRLTHAADHGLLWWGTAAALGATRGRRRRAAVRGMLALGVASAVANGPAKLVFRRNRPANHVVPPVRRPRREHSTFSFPSGHAASAVAFATGVALDAPGAAIPVGALAAAVAFSRVYVGVHYPSDVIAGAALGAGCALITTKVMPRRPRAPARARPASAWAPALPDGDGLTVVVNASSGPGGGRLGGALDVAGLLRAELPAAKVVEVGPHDDLDAALDAAAASARVLGVAGGDGTVNAAAARAIAHGLPLAVFPAGTLNHFAADLGLTASGGLADTVRAVREGSAVAVDVGRVHGLGATGERFEGLFLNTASLGGYADMVAIRERIEKRLGKWPAMVTALGWILRHEPPIEVDIDGERRRLWLVFVGNGIYRPTGFAPTYRSRLDEGLLDLRLVDGAARLARIRLVLAVLTGQLRRCRVYEQRAVRRVEITAAPAGADARTDELGLQTAPDEPLPFAMDGEATDGVRTITITAAAPRLVVYRPR